MNVFIYLDVWKMLENKDFDKVSKLLEEQPNIINSPRGEILLQTCLMEAAEKQQKDCVKFFLKQPHDVSVVDRHGLNVLHRIVRDNKDDVAIDLLRCLDILQLNNNVINQQADYFKVIPLHHAAQNY